MRADTTHRHDVTVIWMGRNNLGDPARIEADVAEAIKSLGSDRYVILTILNGDFFGSEAKRTAGYDAIMNINSSFVLYHFGHVLDIRSYLVSLYDPTNPQDVQDHANDIPPSSLRARTNDGIDRVHLSPEANAMVAQRVADFITQHGW